MDHRVGTVLAARYRIEQVRGTTALGVLYEAHDLQTSRRVSVKIMHAGLDAELAARFAREAKTLQLLAHRNIVAFVDYGDADLRFLATELVRGVTLRDLMLDGLVEPGRALELVRQILDAVGHAHQLGVIHRDLEPETIMLVDGGNETGTGELVKLTDFGFAKLATDTAAVLEESKLTRTGVEVIGSARYPAPEVAFGQIDARTDLYSIGAIAFELLTGRPYHQMSLANAAPDRTFTPALEYLTSEALATDPAHRFASAADMTNALDAAIQSLEVPPVAPIVREPTLPFPPLPTRPPSSGPGAASVAGGPYVEWRAAPGSPDRKRNLVLGGAGFLVFAIICIASAASDDPIAPQAASKPTLAPARSALARHGRDLVAAGNASAAIDHLERGLASSPEDAEGQLVLGHARTKASRRVDAIGAYERALVLSPALGADAQLRTNLSIILESKDTVAGALALELLAKLALHDAIAAQASTHKHLELRRRATAIAERDGFAGKIDRVASWSLDLAQLTGCEARRDVIAKLRDTDARALPALRRARAQTCVAADATDAIAHLSPRF
ncbi:MAG: protein kinase [Kofleriaceae bacterium]